MGYQRTSALNWWEDITNAERYPRAEGTKYKIQNNNNMNKNKNNNN